MSGLSPVAPTLELIQKAQPSRLFEINGSVVRIGRDRAADICLEDKRVSSAHAQVLRRPDGTHLIEDLKSYNNTFLDGQVLTPFTPVPLKDGSRVRVCEYTLVFHEEAVGFREGGGEPTILNTLDDMSTVSLTSAGDRSTVVLRAVLEINRILGGVTDLNEVLGRALEELFGIFRQAERGFILTKEPDGKLTPRATRFRDGDGNGKAPTLSRTVLERVFREGKGLVISDVEGDGRAATVSESLSGSGIRTALCVPILGRAGLPIGIIQLDSKVQRSTFGPEDMLLLAAVAVPIGVVVENHRMLKERAALSAAGEVQMALLPRARPDAPGYVFWQYYMPALEVGGDYYDYIPVETGGSPERWVRWGVALGDVTGKGMPAALLMANLCAEVRHLVRTGAEPDVVASMANRHFFDADLPGRFITFLLVEVDARAHRLTVVNAGHMCPMVRRADGSIEEIGDAEASVPLGVDRDVVFRSATTHVEPGEVVVLYTDGINEAMGKDDALFGIDGVKQIVAAVQGGPAQVGDAIIRGVRTHTHGRNQSDDIALVCFGRDPV